MFLRYLKLKNIRSYKDERIDFPKGSLLLSGDIGSGKSTILLAIEFCFFGFRPKDLDGNTLLRHGKKEGIVELGMDIDGKEVIINRSLKRSKNRIGQSSGYIIKEGKKKELTPVELKAEVLGLLGYPRNILTKSKDLIYRYTVYTPQEDMKRIISEDSETRLDVLRKVFNMDKYSKIKDNSNLYIRVLKDRSKILEGQSQGIEEIKQQKKERVRDTEELSIKIKGKIPNHENAKKALADKKIQLEILEKDIRKTADIKKNIEMEEYKLRMKVEQRHRNAQDIENLTKIINETKVTKIEDDFEEDINKEIKTRENILLHHETTIKKLNELIAGFRIEKKNALEIKTKISSIKTCPTCEQEVAEVHKKNIFLREDAKIKDNTESENIYQEQLKKSETEIIRIRKEMDNLRDSISKIVIEKEKIKKLNNDIIRKDALTKEQDAIKSNIGKINETKINLNKELATFPDLEMIYRKSKEDFETISAEERKIALEINSLEKEKEGLQLLISSIDRQIVEKENAIRKLKEIRNIIQWLEDFFINVVSIIEKNVLFSIYNEFNSLFREWFNMLIQEENLQVRLDEQFSPVVTQNDYDINFTNLSGGEKTSIALAYRLALNKVINDLISGIRTSDLIILDEPTDGFSIAQLDKVRDVLEQLQNRQILIVSHEPKIETFVDNVIRVYKDEHESKIIN